MRDPFVVSSITWHEISGKIDPDNINLVEETLLENLNLRDYGDLMGIAFIYIVKPTGNEIHQEEFTYSRKKKELYIQIRLPYYEVQSASTNEVLHMMANKYLQTMQERLPKKKIPGFNWISFVEDVRNLFERKGWLQEVEAM
ncbi:hypothetical protein [Haliscomenobacter hydrossis]|uniref:Uncharacterized protein n=1 Tax=Haliscomenobacter hydrossis (strain ATCC 27775 / DSM 1100 / LMG 10767 / O) TaxID=760192 RepID=F4KWB6_HALH1|nr:hypothetical protein [Haliscomenobacter hydrossis]AEE50266.1 hypothetical protein Halhy_2391 [Haliscomenobacter hydrossis DSM 1100]